LLANLNFNRLHVCVYLAYWIGAKALRNDRSERRNLLLTQPKLCEYGTIPLKISPFQVPQQASSLANKLQQASPTVMIFLVDFEVLGEFRDSTGEESDLNLGCPGVLLARAKLRDYFALAFSCH